VLVFSRLRAHVKKDAESGDAALADP